MRRVTGSFKLLRRCSGGRSLVFVLAVLVLLPVGDIGAVEVSGLFTAEVALDGDARNPRRAAYQRALREVIGRVTAAGRADPLAVDAVIEGAEQLVIGYRDSGNERLWVSFDGPTLIALLRQRGVAVWGSDRPLTVVWLAVDRGDGRREILSASSDLARGDRARLAEPADFLRQRLEREATQRGLPLALPLMDAEDRAVIEFADVWGDFDEVLRDASDRYAAVSILSGRAAPGRSDAIRWNWRFAGAQTSFTGSVENAVRRVAGDMGSALALAGNDDVRRVTVAVDAVNDAAAFGRLLKFLQRQPQLKRVDVTGMDGALLELELHYVGPMERIERLLAGAPGLVAATPPFGAPVGLDAAALAPTLYYRLRP